MKVKRTKLIKKFLDDPVFLRLLVGIVIGFQLIVMVFLSMTRSIVPPKEIIVGNITDSSLTVSWTTDKPSSGGIFLNSQENPLLRGLGFFLCEFFSYRCNFINDDTPKASTTHFINIGNLTPETPYYYRIVSSGRLFKTDAGNNVLPSLITGPVLGIPTLPNPVYSYILRGDGKTPVAESLVTISLVGNNDKETKSSLITTVTDKNGLFLVDLGNLRTPDLRFPIQTSINDRLSITVFGSNNFKATSFVNYSPKELVPINVKKQVYE